MLRLFIFRVLAVLVWLPGLADAADAEDVKHATQLIERAWDDDSAYYAPCSDVGSVKVLWANGRRVERERFFYCPASSPRDCIKNAKKELRKDKPAETLVVTSVMAAYWGNREFVNWVQAHPEAVIEALTMFREDN